MGSEIQKTNRVRDRIRQIWNDPLETPAGALHVCAVASRRDGSPGVMRITPDTPTSPTDQFSLEIARARADVILTSGSILRNEPHLLHVIGDDANRWRQDVLHKKDPPEIIFMTRGQTTPLDHPALRQPGVTVATEMATPESFLNELRKRGLRHRGIPADSPAELVRALLHSGAGTISLEVGPSTAAQFYEGPTRVSELMLSWCRSLELPESLDAGNFPPLDQLRRTFGKPCHETSVQEASSLWSFTRWVASE